MADPLTCLVAAIFFEARDQPLLGQEMVAHVIMNRVEHHAYPDDVCSVVYERRQFSFTHDGMSDDPGDYTTYYDRRAYERAVEVASQFLEGGTTEETTSTHYHAVSVAPGWARVFTIDGQVGDHIFYTNETPYK